MSVAEKFEVIADAVYKKGVADGKATGVDWDNIQQNGTRKYWDKAFAYWGEEEVNPKYMIKPTAIATTGAQSMFQGSWVKKVNWSKFDFSECVTLYTAFNSCPNLEEIGIYDEDGNPQGDFELSPTSTSATMWNYMFSGGRNLKRIQKIVTKLNQIYTSTFSNCLELEEIRFAPYDEASGIGIGNDISFADSPKLTKESIESIFNALSDDVTGKTATFNANVQANVNEVIFGVGIGQRPFAFGETYEVRGLTFTNDNNDMIYISGEREDPYDEPSISLMDSFIVEKDTMFMLYDMDGIYTNCLAASIYDPENGSDWIFGSSTTPIFLKKGTVINGVYFQLYSGVYEERGVNSVRPVFVQCDWDYLVSTKQNWRISLV